MTGHLDEHAVARAAAAWLLWYPDEELAEQLPRISAAVATLGEPLSAPLTAFLEHLHGTPILQVQRHYVSVFDMKRRACPYLTYWTDGDTRNRGAAILRFKQAYTEAGFSPSNRELPDHLAVLLEFAALGDRQVGDALLAEHAAPIRLMREALVELESAYAHVLDAVVATLPAMTPQLRERILALASSGPPAEQVGLEPFPGALNLEPIGGRR